MKSVTSMNKTLLTIIFYLLSTVLASAQIFRELSGAQGLSNLIVNSICKDHSGYVWLGTGSSVERFDGYHFRHYSNPVLENSRSDVYVVREIDNKIYCGSLSGLWTLENDHLVRLHADKINCGVYDILSDHHLIYIGTDKGLFVKDGNQLKQVLVNNDITSDDNEIKDICSDGKGNLWLATSAGLCKYGIREKRIYRTTLTAKSDFMSSLVVNNQQILMGTNAGVIRYDIPSGQHQSYLDIPNVSSLNLDGKGQLYVATNGDGVYVYALKGKRLVRHIAHLASDGNNIRSNSIYSFLLDPDGIQWFGLYQLGLDYSLYQRNVFNIVNIPNVDMRRYSIRTIEIDNHHRLIGAREGLIYYDSNRNITKVFGASEMRSPMVLSSTIYQGKFIVGTFGGGVYELDPQTSTLKEFAAEGGVPSSSAQVLNMAKDKNGCLWIGTSEGLYGYQGNKLLYHLDSRNSKLNKGIIYCVFFDSQNRGWISTEKGLYLLSAGKERLISQNLPDGFINREPIRAIYEDDEHQLYFVPVNGKLFVSNLNLTDFHRVSGTMLDNLNLQFIIEDADHWLWIGTNDGLYRYDKKETVVPFSFADGVPTRIFLACQPKKTADGRYWFGSTKGLFYTDIHSIHQTRKYKYPLLFTEVKIDNDSSVTPLPVAGEKTIYRVDLEHGLSNHISVLFSDFSYSSPSDASYEYRMGGDDDKWVLLKGKSELEFSNLSSGTYKLHLRRPGLPETEIILQIHVGYSLALLLTCGILLLLMIVGGIYLYRHYKRFYQWLYRAAKKFAKKAEGVMGEQNKYQSSNISDDDCKALLQKVDELMNAEKPYLNAKLKISDLADLLKVPTYKLSYLFNQHMKKSFYDYVNDYRISEFKAFVAAGEHEKFTLNALIERSGFLSRASFFRYFKKELGMTPTEYISKTSKK